MKVSNYTNARDVFLNKLCFAKFLPLSSNRLIVFVLAQFTFVFLTLATPGPELVSCVQPFEQVSTEPESEPNSESTDRSIADADARLSRPRKAPSRLSKIFVKTISIPTPADTILIAKKSGSFSRTDFSPTQPSVFRNLPLII